MMPYGEIEIELLTISRLSQSLGIKPSTLYAWTRQGKIPFVKIHRLIRFDPDEIAYWLQSLKEKTNSSPKIEKVTESADKRENKSSRMFSDSKDINRLIERAKQEVYNSNRGETRPKSSPKEGEK